MSRAEKTVAISAVTLCFYQALWLGYVPVGQTVQEKIVPVLPFVVLIWFGCYLLFKLGLGVFTFNDIPEAHKELMGQIEQARKELRAKGVDVD